MNKNNNNNVLINTEGGSSSKKHRDMTQSGGNLKFKIMPNKKKNKKENDNFFQFIESKKNAVNEQSDYIKCKKALFNEDG